jgi:hypothetical protein
MSTFLGVLAPRWLRGSGRCSARTTAQISSTFCIAHLRRMPTRLGRRCLRYPPVYDTSEEETLRTS